MSPPHRKSPRARTAIALACLVAALASACSNPSGGDGDGGAIDSLLGLAYCGTAHPEQTLDLYLPEDRVATPTPLTIHVHGGGWFGGDKATGTWFVEVAEELLGRGYAVASVDYRLAPGDRWPAQIDDVACAVRFLRQIAGQHGIDPNRFGVWGNSAGGHLAAQLATTSGPGAPERVQAVVALWSILDLTAADTPVITQFAIGGLMGRPFDPADPALAQASPITHVSAGDPPFLLVHGERDLVVLPNQSERFAAALAQRGVPRELVLVENGGHEVIPFGGPIDPTEGQIIERIADFFDQRLLGR